MASLQALNPHIEEFVERSGFSKNTFQPLAGDASTRSYMRVQSNSSKAILMIAPPNAEAAACPPAASKAERERLGYNAMARLAGPNLSAFVEIANVLRSNGLAAPEIYAVDLKLGLALTEDLGDELFARIATSTNETELYELAVDGLVLLHQQIETAPATSEFTIQDYDKLAYRTEASLFTEWYWPLFHGAEPISDLVEEFIAIFDDLLSELAAPSTLVLRDYHAENLLFLPDRTGIERLGLIDFQDALMGSRAYDLVSLLEDARRDVSPHLQDAMIEKYCCSIESSKGLSVEQFQKEYAILALQRNAKILGVFARLAKRDGKTRYLELLPRVEAHFKRDLARPEAATLKNFMGQHFAEKFS